MEINFDQRLTRMHVQIVVPDGRRRILARVKMPAHPGCRITGAGRADKVHGGKAAVRRGCRLPVPGRRRCRNGAAGIDAREHDMGGPRRAPRRAGLRPACQPPYQPANLCDVFVGEIRPGGTDSLLQSVGTGHGGLASFRASRPDGAPTRMRGNDISEASWPSSGLQSTLPCGRPAGATCAASATPARPSRTKRRARSPQRRFSGTAHSQRTPRRG